MLTRAEFGVLSTFEETGKYEEKMPSRTLFSLKLHQRKTQDFGVVGLIFLIGLGFCLNDQTGFVL